MVVFHLDQLTHGKLEYMLRFMDDVIVAKFFTKPVYQLAVQSYCYVYSLAPLTLFMDPIMYSNLPWITQGLGPFLTGKSYSQAQAQGFSTSKQLEVHFVLFSTWTTVEFPNYMVTKSIFSVPLQTFSYPLQVLNQLAYWNANSMMSRGMATIQPT